MYKRLTAACLALMMLISLAACHGEKPNNSQSESASSSSSNSQTTIEDDFSSITTESQGEAALTSTTAESQGNKTSSSTRSTIQPAADDSILPKMNLTNKKVRIMLHGELGAGSIMPEYIKKAYGLEVDCEVVAAEQMLTRFVNRAMAKDPPDLYPCFFKPSLYNSGYVQPWDGLIDLDSKLWKDVKNEVTQYKWNGHIYSISPKFDRYAYVYYNKAMFDEAGEDYPADLFRKNKWDWNVFKNLSKQLTVDPQNTGTPTQYGVGIGEGEYLMYTTGSHFITFGANGELKNNLKSAEVARAMNFYIDLRKSGKMYSGTTPREAFAQGQIAMLVGHMWYLSSFKNLVARNELGMAPLPKDPAAASTYTLADSWGWCLSKDAKNVQGAVALMNTWRWYYSDEKAIQQNREYEMKNGYTTKELYAEMDLNKQIKNTLPPLWGAFNFSAYSGEIWNAPLAGESWSSVAERIYPQLQFEIDQAKDAMVQDE